MALSVRFIQHLNSEEMPESKHSRLSKNNIYARNEWDKDLTCRWTTNACAECNNQECMLQHILALEDLQSESGSIYEVKELVVKSLVSVLCNSSLTKNALMNENTSFFEKVFHGCSCILSNIEMQLYFKSNLETLTLFMRSFLDFQSCTLKTSNSGIKSMAQNCFSFVIDFYLQIYKQFSNKELFAQNFLKNILPFFCNLTKFEKIDQSIIDIELHRCIQTLLFTKAFHIQYKKFTVEREGIPSTLFSTLSKITNTDLEVSFTIFETVLRVAIKSYESDTKVIDLIFRNMLESSGRDKKVLKKLLNCLNGINLSMDNKIEDVMLSEFLVNCVNEILLKEHLESLDFELIARIVNINPFIIENDLEKILIKILPKISKVDETSYNQVFIAILNASISLRREHKLILQLLMTVKDMLAQNSDTEIFVSFPQEFLLKFMESISNITTSQTITILRSFAFNLKLCCVDISLPSFSKSGFVMLEVIVGLIIPFMKGIKIFDYVKNVNAQKKFCRSLFELGDSFSSMVDRILKIDCNKRVIFIFVKACQAWNDVCNLISHYVSNLASDELSTLFSSKKLLKLIAKVENSIEDDSENIVSEFSQSLFINFIENEKLITSINCRSSLWVSVVRNNPGVLSKLDNHQILEIAETVVKDFTEDFVQGLKKWDKSKTNIKFVTAVVNQVIINSRNNFKSSTVNQLLGKIVSDFNWKKVISKIKKGTLLGNEVECSKNRKAEDSKAMEEYLYLFSFINLEHLNYKTRIVLFVLISSINLEFAHDNKVSEKCNDILLKLLQENDIDIFQFTNLPLLDHLNSLRKDNLSLLFELPLKNDSFNSLINFLDSNEIKNDMMSVFLNIVQKVKLHKNSEDIQSLRNLIKKWDNQSIKDDKNYNTINIVNLTFSLKYAVSDKKVSDELKEMTNRILNNIFQNSDKESKINEECFQLMELVLRNRFSLEIPNNTINLISKAILHNASENILPPFLETLSPVEYNLFLKSLHQQTTYALEKEKDELLTNCLLIWDYISIINMAKDRNKLRLLAINNLFCTIERVAISEKHWLSLLKLFETIASSKSIHITEKNIDMILLSCMKCMKRVGVSACRNILSLYTIIVKLRTNFIKEKLSLLVLLNTEIIKTIRHEGEKLGNFNDQYQLECLILDLDKFVIALLKLGGNVSEICPYLLSDLVEWYSYHLLPKNSKASLEIIIQHLLSHCEHEAIEYLNRTLPVPTQKVFKELVTMYRRYYKFTGKI